MKTAHITNMLHTYSYVCIDCTITTISNTIYYLHVLNCINDINEILEYVFVYVYRFQI